MKYRARYSKQALQDKKHIKSYLSQYYESTVKSFFDLLKKRIERIKKYPFSCPSYEDDPDYRRLVVGEYLLFYMVNNEEKSVDIIRIFHSSRDISRQLNKGS